MGFPSNKIYYKDRYVFSIPAWILDDYDDLSSSDGLEYSSFNLDENDCIKFKVYTSKLLRSMFEKPQD